jgi:hypothetical protein
MKKPAKPARYAIFQLAEGAIPCGLFLAILHRMDW